MIAAATLFCWSTVDDQNFHYSQSMYFKAFSLQEQIILVKIPYILNFLKCGSRGHGVFFNLASSHQLSLYSFYVSRLNINVPWLSPFESKWDIELSGLHLLVVPSSSVQYDEEKEKEIEFQVSFHFYVFFMFFWMKWITTVRVKSKI